MNQDVQTLKTNSNEEFFRFSFNEPVAGRLAIEEIGGTKIQSGKTIVKVKDFSAGGLSFESNFIIFLFAATLT